MYFIKNVIIQIELFVLILYIYTLFRAVNKIMNQLDIDPTELRGIGIQINKLENRTVKGIGCIENFLSNMKFEPKENKIFVEQNSDNNRMTSKKIAESKSHEDSSIINNKNTNIIYIDNKNNPKTIEPIDLCSKVQPSSSKSTSGISHQPLVDIKMSQIDPAFLDALPAEVREEIENELKANEHKNSLSIQHKKTSMDDTMTEESSKLYQQVHVDQMKEFVEEWVNTEHEPKVCDNIMVSEYLCNLVKDVKTEDAYEIIRKLYR